MLTILFKTGDSIAPLFLRLALGVVMFAHGAQKVLGWFGGAGIAGTITSFTEGLGLTAWMAVLQMIIEFGGGIALMTGFLSRLAALGVFSSMTFAAYYYHLPYGFFINWFGRQEGEGIEFHILVLGMSLAIMVLGGGRFSLDQAIWNRLDRGI